MATAPKTDSSAMRRFGPLAALVLLAQLGIAWVLIQALLKKEPPAGTVGDEMLTQTLMGQRTDAAVEEQAGDLPYYWTPGALRRIAVNPAGTDGMRALVISLQLGLHAFDRSKEPPKDITATLATQTEMLATLERYASRMRAIVSESTSRRRVADFEGHREGLLEEVRERLNREVLQRAFPRGEADKHPVVVEVVLTELIIQ